MDSAFPPVPRRRRRSSLRSSHRRVAPVAGPPPHSASPPPAARTKPSTLFHYRAIGSGGGRKEFGVSWTGASTVVTLPASVQNQFAASDTPLSTSQNPLLSSIPSFLHFPSALATIGMFHSIPIGLGGYSLNLTKCVINDIYAGRCASWSCPQLLAINPNFNPPVNQPFAAATFRSDSSGTSNVFSGWLNALSGACGPATAGGANSSVANSPFGPINSTPYTGSAATAAGAIAAGANYFYSTGALPATTTSYPCAAGTRPAYSLAAAGTAGVISALATTSWSLGYAETGQALAAGLQEGAILNVAGYFVTSGATFSSVASVVGALPTSLLPYPDGSTAASAVPNNNVFQLFSASCLDISAGAAFPVITPTYVIVPTPAAQQTMTSAYDAESMAALIAFLQYLYMPEVTVGYNAACGYSPAGSLTISTVAYTCASYSPGPILAGFYFASMPTAWVVTVLTSLNAWASSATSTLAFGSSTPLAYLPAGTAPYGGSGGGLLYGVRVPTWTFEPTETAIAVSGSAGAAGVGGSGERIISYNRFSYADFQRDQNAENIGANQAAIGALNATLVGTSTCPPGAQCLGDRTITYRLYGSGSSLQSKLIWRAMDLLQSRAKTAVRMTYRGIGSGTGRNEFIGASNAYLPWGHFAASDTPMNSAQASSLATNGKTTLTIPTTLAAIGVFHTVPATANLPAGVSLNLTANVVCGIFAGAITLWTDPAIRALNPALVAPANQGITVISRQDTSGTTQVFATWLAATCTTNAPSSGQITNAATTDFPSFPASSRQPGSIGMTSYLSTPANTWAIGYVDSGFALDAGLQEAALELKPGSNVFATSTALGSAGLSAPTSYSGTVAGTVYSSVTLPTSSMADWSGVPISFCFNQYTGSGTQFWPIVTFSYVFLRQDMTQFGESGRLAAALLRFLFSADAGTPAQLAAESPASPLKFYAELLMSQPPNAVKAQALADMATIQFAPSAPNDWGFETFYASAGSCANPAGCGGSSTNGYNQYNGFGDRMFSVWRSDYQDYKVTQDAQTVNANANKIAANLALITANAAAAAANTAAIGAVTATLNSLLAGNSTSLLAAVAALQAQLNTSLTLQQVQINDLASRGSPSSTPGAPASTTDVATAAIVIGAVTLAFAAFSFAYFSYLRPRAVDQGSKGAIMMTNLPA